MIGDNVLQQMYELACSLHSDTGVALSVTMEACERITLLRRLQERRSNHYKFVLPAACLPQYCVYLASDRRERAQEYTTSGQDAGDPPTKDDRLVRYIKFLVWQTMDRNACHVAVALGCFLYKYQPSEIANLAPEIFNQHNIRRVKRRLAHQIQARFQCAHSFNGKQHILHTRPPTEHERQLVFRTLAMCTPWGCAHVPTPAPDRSILETHFDGVSGRFDWDRIHALIDPSCAGLPRLIREYNHSLPAQSAVRLADPDHTLEIPCFDL